MLDELTFGEFVAVKRKQTGISLGEFSRKTGLSPSYCSNVESGKRPAPAGDTQELFALILRLDDDEKIHMYDLAAKTKKQGTLPYDIVLYLNNDREILCFLRRVNRLGLEGQDLLKLI